MKAGHVGRQMDFAPVPGERHLLCRCDVLAAKKDHPMIQQHLIDRAKSLLIQNLRQIDTTDFRAHAAG